MTAASPLALVAQLPKVVERGRWALRLAWGTSPALLLAVTGVSLLRGVLPGALAWIARGLVNSTLLALSSAEAGWREAAPWLLAGFVATVIEGVSGFLASYLERRLQDELQVVTTYRVLEHASGLDVESFEDPALRDGLQRAQDSPGSRIAVFVTNGLAAGSAALQVLSLFAVLAAIEPLMMLAAVLFLLPYLIFETRLAQARFELEQSRTTRRRWSSYFMSLLTSRATVAEVRLLRLSPLLLGRFGALMREFRNQDRELYGRALGGGTLFTLFTTASIYALFFRVVFRATQGALTLGDVAIFGGAAVRLRNAAGDLVRRFSGVVEQTLFLQNLKDYLELRPSSRATGTRTSVKPDPSSIELEEVSFTYPGAGRPALDRLSMRVEPGETVALVGANGAGKTTLVKLIARLYEPDDGRVLVSGIDSRELDPDELRARISFVFQGFTRFEASAADNIAFGDWEELLDDRRRVEDVSRRSGIGELVESLPAGYDTRLGRVFGEADLSDGQWQRLAVARAFARESALLILDEPTASLDAAAEYELFRRFRDLAEGRTTILISHRFSTVSLANRVIVLESGRVVESGSHEALLASKGPYAHLYRLYKSQQGCHDPEGPPQPGRGSRGD